MDFWNSANFRRISRNFHEISSFLETSAEIAANRWFFVAIFMKFDRNCGKLQIIPGTPWLLLSFLKSQEKVWNFSKKMAKNELPKVWMCPLQQRRVSSESSPWFWICMRSSWPAPSGLKASLPGLKDTIDYDWRATLSFVFHSILFGSSPSKFCRNSGTLKISNL